MIWREIPLRPADIRQRGRVGSKKDRALAKDVEANMVDVPRQLSSAEQPRLTVPHDSECVAQ